MAIHQLVFKAIAAEGRWTCLRRWAGSTPYISILSEEDLSEVRDLLHRAPFAGTVRCLRGDKAK